LPEVDYSRAVVTAYADSEDAASAAMRARLTFLEDEITRLVNLASAEKDPKAQEQYWALAKELQREAREARAVIAERTV